MYIYTCFTITACPSRSRVFIYWPYTVHERSMVVCVNMSSLYLLTNSMRFLPLQSVYIWYEVPGQAFHRPHGPCLSRAGCRLLSNWQGVCLGQLWQDHPHLPQRQWPQQVSGARGSDTGFQQIGRLLSALVVFIFLQVSTCLEMTQHCVLCVWLHREVYHTKRMQHVISIKWSSDNKYILSASDEMNIRLWKANAAEKLGLVRQTVLFLSF